MSHRALDIEIQSQKGRKALLVIWDRSNLNSPNVKRITTTAGAWKTVYVFGDFFSIFLPSSDYSYRTVMAMSGSTWEWWAVSCTNSHIWFVIGPEQQVSCHVIHEKDWWPNNMWNSHDFYVWWMHVTDAFKDLFREKLAAKIIASDNIRWSDSSNQSRHVIRSPGWTKCQSFREQHPRVIWTKTWSTSSSTQHLS